MSDVESKAGRVTRSPEDQKQLDRRLRVALGSKPARDRRR